jgi:ABC-type branched-subunit amino acid transport system substrate-binding protein
MKPIVKDLREIVEKQLNTTFNMDHTMPLDGLYALMQAIEKAQSLDSDKVATTLENMKSIDTIYGKGTMGGQELFGINHVIRRPVTLSRIMNGKVEFDFFEK